MAILKLEILGKNTVGVYLTANNQFVLYPTNLQERILKKLKSVFQVPLYPLTINNSNLLGVYTTSNKYGIIVPEIIRDDELEKLKSHVGNGFRQGTIQSLDNAYGNLIVCNDKGAIISSLLKEKREKIEDILNVETVVYNFAGTLLPGSIAIANNQGCLVHPLARDDEIEYISSVLRVETDVSTVNRGVPYLNSGTVVNDKTGVFGKDSTGPEMMRLTNVLKIQ
ncbi:MAG: translation initiation factor IF-6 [Promethearchaeia archaeon]